VQAFRYLLVIGAGFLAGNRLVEAAWSWQQWRGWLGRDAVGAEAYRTFFFLNAGVALISICLAALVWHLLRPRQSAE